MGKQAKVNLYPNAIVLREHNKRTSVIKTDIGIQIEWVRIFENNGDCFGAFMQKGKLQVASIHLKKESVADLICMLQDIINKK